MKLRTRIAITTAGTATAVAMTGAFLLPPANARPVTRSHTLTFTSVRIAATQFSRPVSAQDDKDVSKAGKVIGFDVLRFSADPKTHAAAINVAADLAGGILYGKMTSNGSPDIRGTVTGGTGAFKGAKGTITARSLDHTGARTAVTVTYHP